MADRATVTRSLVAFIGRIFFAVYFLANGISKAYLLYHAYKGPSLGSSGALLAITILQLLGGLLVLLGWYTRFGAFLLFAAVCIITGFEFHLVPYHNAGMLIIANLGLAGAALYIMAFGAGSCGLDALRSRNK